VLRHVLDDPDWLSRADSEADEQTLRELLHMPALLQYRNGGMKWFRPSPVLSEWLRNLSRPDREERGTSSTLFDPGAASPPGT
jgi:hypothetical protein